MIRYRLASGICYSHLMEMSKQPNNYIAAGARGRSDQSLKAASLLLCSVLAGCASSLGNPAPSANSPPSSLSTVGQAAVPGQAPTPVATTPPISDGAHPNQSITDLFRNSPSPEANVPRPPSSYTPVGQPYSAPGQPAYGASQSVAGTSTGVAAAPPPAPPVSDGAHPNQSITDLFRQ